MTLDHVFKLILDITRLHKIESKTFTTNFQQMLKCLSAPNMQGHYFLCSQTHTDMHGHLTEFNKIKIHLRNEDHDKNLLFLSAKAPICTQDTF